MHHLRNLLVAVRMTLATTVLFGILYPLVVTGMAQVLFPTQANGQLLERNGAAVGSVLIGQGFTSPAYFWPRPSATAIPYDAANSAGSQWGPTNKMLIEAVAGNVARMGGDPAGDPVPIDLVTSSASGFDPHISPAAAAFQVRRVARARGVPDARVRQLVEAHTEPRQFGLLGEPRVNVLLLNLALDAEAPPVGR